MEAALLYSIYSIYSIYVIFHTFLRVFPHVTYLSSNYLLFLGFLYDF